MSDEEINEEFEIAPVFLHWVITIMGLNALIELTQRDGLRNFTKDPYYNIKYSPVSPHKIHCKSISEFKNIKINTSSGDGILLHKHWKHIHKL